MFTFHEMNNEVENLVNAAKTARLEKMTLSELLNLQTSLDRNQNPVVEKYLQEKEETAAQKALAKKMIFGAAFIVGVVSLLGTIGGFVFMIEGVISALLPSVSLLGMIGSALGISYGHDAVSPNKKKKQLEEEKILNSAQGAVADMILRRTENVCQLAEKEIFEKRLTSFAEKYGLNDTGKTDLTAIFNERREETLQKAVAPQFRDTQPKSAV